MSTHKGSCRIDYYRGLLIAGIRESTTLNCHRDYTSKLHPPEELGVPTKVHVAGSSMNTPTALQRQITERMKQIRGGVVRQEGLERQ